MLMLFVCQLVLIRTAETTQGGVVRGAVQGVGGSRECGRVGAHPVQALVERLDKGGFTAAVRCLADDLDALVVHFNALDRQRHKRARYEGTEQIILAEVTAA